MRREPPCITTAALGRGIRKSVCIFADKSPDPPPMIGNGNPEQNNTMMTAGINTANQDAAASEMRGVLAAGFSIGKWREIVVLAVHAATFVASGSINR